MLLGCVLIVASTLVNVLGVRLLSRINNVGVFAEMAGAVALIVLLALEGPARGGSGPGDAGAGAMACRWAISGRSWPRRWSLRS